MLGHMHIHTCFEPHFSTHSYTHRHTAGELLFDEPSLEVDEKGHCSLIQLAWGHPGVCVHVCVIH